MAERASGRMLSANELVLRKLKATFDTKGRETEDCTVWVMLAAVVPFGSSHALPSWPLPSTKEKPSHQTRVVVRTSTDDGANPYVDGSDFFLIVDLEKQSAEFVWEPESFGYSPEFNGGTIESAFEWTRQLAEPCFVQLEIPSVSQK